MSQLAPPDGDFDPQAFREMGYQVVDWLTNYLTELESYPVLSRAHPGDLKSQLPPSAPNQPESLDAILNDMSALIVPGLTHWQHPGFMAYFTSSASAPGILGEMLAAGISVNGMLWRTSPAATELEEHVLDWLRQALNLPTAFKGIICDTASISSLLALAAARETLQLDVRQQGLAGRPDLPRLRVYTSEQAHSSIAKGAITLGIGAENVLGIALDDQFRMDVSVLRGQIEADLAAGYRPFCVAATIGTTSTTAVDPVPAIAALCREFGLWLHVDAAWAGNAALVPEYAHLLNGVAEADSFVFNPHKWLFTPVDVSCFYVRNPAVLKAAFSLVPEYLRTADTTTNNYMDWGVQLGRRFRALKLWMVIRMFGLDGLRSRLRSHLQWGHDFAAWVDAHPDFERLAPNPIATVCFRARPRRFATDDSPTTAAYLEKLNQTLMDTVNAAGDIFISHTRLNNQLTLRVAIGNVRTRAEHVSQAWQILQQTAAQLDAELSA